MRPETATGISICVGKYDIKCYPDGLPCNYHEIATHAKLVDEFHIGDTHLCCVLIGRANEWPSVVVAQSCELAEAGFEPGIYLAQESDFLFVAVGERLLGYDLAESKRKWTDHAKGGFWRFARHESVVLMTAELELAAWNPKGDKLWNASVEPPWSYSVERGVVVLDEDGHKKRFSLFHGP